MKSCRFQQKELQPSRQVTCSEAMKSDVHFETRKKFYSYLISYIAYKVMYFN